MPMLADRLIAAIDWLKREEATSELPIGLFGASTGGGALPLVEAPTLLIVGERDEMVITLNEKARADMRGELRLEIVPGATHLFEESGALERVAALARDWFLSHLHQPIRGG
jgi:putative phosphoribosyl transferase